MTILFTILITEKVENVLFVNVPNREFFDAQIYEHSLKAISEVEK